MAMRDTHPTGPRARIRSERAGTFGLCVIGSVVIAVSLLLSTTLKSRPASAQPVCGEHIDILNNLEKFHSETPQAIGLSTDGKVIEILVSPSGSWSILVNYPDRRTCLVATGDDWETLPVVPTGPSV